MINKIKTLCGMFLVLLLLTALVINYADAQTGKAKTAKKVTLHKSTKPATAINPKDSCINPAGCGGKGMGFCRMKDKFIDKDSDGINDNRCRGIGLGKQMNKGKFCKKKK